MPVGLFIQPVRCRPAQISSRGTFEGLDVDQRDAQIVATQEPRIARNHIETRDEREARLALQKIGPQQSRLTAISRKILVRKVDELPAQKRYTHSQPGSGIACNTSLKTPYCSRNASLL